MAARSLSLGFLLVVAMCTASSSAAALPLPAGPYTIRLLQQETVLVVGDQPPPPPASQPLYDALQTMIRQLPVWAAGQRPPVVEGPAGPLLERVTTTTAAPTTTTKKKGIGLHSFINAPDRPCPDGQLRDVTGQCREPW